MLKTRAADIVLTSKDNIVVRFLNIFQKDLVTWGHIALVDENDDFIEAKRRVQVTPRSKFLKKRKHLKVIRMTNLDWEESKQIIQAARDLIGKGYSVSRFAFQFLDNVFGTNWFSGNYVNTEEQICSSLIAWAFYKVLGYKFNGVRWSACEPDDIDDDVEKNPKTWIVMYES